VTDRPFPAVEGVHHGFAQADGIRLHYAETGPPQGEPVLLVHGWPQHWYCWRKVMPLLGDRFRVIALDLRGYGWSEAPDTSYSKEEFADDILGLVRALELDAVRLVGHDWGGFAGFLACLREPERFRSFLSLSTSHPWPNRMLNPQSVVAAALYQPLMAVPVVAPLAQRYLPFYRALYALSGGSRVWSADEIEVYAAAFREPDRARAASRTYRTFLLHELPTLASRYHGQRLRVPTRLVVGESDPVVSRELIAGGERHGDHFVIERVRGGHFLPEAKPQVVADRLS
jgi:pimeloyl-ACP methyl ester carboxylesterase